MSDTQFFMVRLLDHAGYYETRCLLALLTGAFAAVAWRRGDRRFAIAFASGVLFQSLLEWTLQANGLRGAYALSVFGAELSGPAGILLQGAIEGGPLSLFGYWFVRTTNRVTQALGGEKLYFAGLIGVTLLATVAAILASGAPVSSARPIRFLDPLLIATIIVAIGIAATKGWIGLRQLGAFFIGVLIYAVATFEPLHVAGVRYIGEGAANDYRAASWPIQIAIMAASLAIEISASKLHYFAVPFALGLFKERAKP